MQIGAFGFRVWLWALGFIGLGFRVWVLGLGSMLSTEGSCFETGSLGLLQQ